MGRGGVAHRNKKRHRLQNEWALWVLLPNGPGRQNWKDSQQKVHEFKTIEGFWCLHNNIRTPSALGISDFSIFKRGMQPAWEDPNCAGRWVAKIDYRGWREHVDEAWLTAALMVIGENFHEVGGDQICGTVVSVRQKNAKFALWIGHCDLETTAAIGRVFLAAISKALQTSVSLDFEAFGNPEGGFTLTAESQEQFYQDHELAQTGPPGSQFVPAVGHNHPAGMAPLVPMAMESVQMQW